jgi:hypothetical protein
VEAGVIDQDRLARIRAAIANGWPASGTATSMQSVRTVRVADVTPERVEWLWNGRIPRAMITLVDGDPGLGKSTMTLDLAARVSRGRAMPYDTHDLDRTAADVIIMTAEDHLAATIRPRLDAAGADTSRVYAITAMPRPTDPEAPPTLAPDDVARLESAISERHSALVIIDPLMAFLPSEVDSHRDQDVRRVLRPLAAVAERTRAAIVIVRHLRKVQGSALYRGGGSIGIAGAARSVLLVAPAPTEDPDAPDNGERIVASTKSNLGRVPEALRWRLIDSPDHGAARIEWLGIARGVTADQLAAPQPLPSNEDRHVRARTVEALRRVLTGGPLPVRKVERLVADMTGASPRTIERARAEAGVIAEHVRKSNGRITGVVLRLDESTPPRRHVDDESDGVDGGDEVNYAQSHGDSDDRPHRHSPHRHVEEKADGGVVGRRRGKP